MARGFYKRVVLHRRVVVNKLDGTALDGVLWDETGPLLVLKGARLLEAGGEPVDIDGEVIVERSAINFVQVLP
jgi:hypothetical protein